MGLGGTLVALYDHLTTEGLDVEVLAKQSYPIVLLHLVRGQRVDVRVGIGVGVRARVAYHQ